MRVTHRHMYQSMTSQMNKSLSAYMESNEQGATQKRINKPSDDPMGMAKVLNYRAAIARNEQYESNSADASAWLTSADAALTQSKIILDSLIEKASQISTGTVTAENRKQVAMEIRELFAQLVNLANTSYAGQHLFSGHKTNSSAYEIGLGITTFDDNWLNADKIDGSTGQVAWEVSGKSNSTVMVRFLDDGEIGKTNIRYEYSNDGGETWTTKTLNGEQPSPPAPVYVPGDNVLDLDGVKVTIPLPNSLDPKSDLVNFVEVTAYNADEDTGMHNGTMLYVRPTAYYMGDDNDTPAQIDAYGSSSANITSTKASGVFTSDVRVRIDEDVDISADGTFQYSYSTDNGVTWLTATGTTRTDSGGNTTARLEVPGGFLDVVLPTSAGQLDSGQQFVIRPSRADTGIEISPGVFISVTNCGKDIFGGMYTPNGESTAIPASGTNIFEIISEFIAMAESGHQEGCQNALANLEEAVESILTHIAKIGGKANRVEYNITMLETQRDDTSTRMSREEDIDLTTLLTKLTQQYLAYQTVLQSSSMIMNMNLTNFL